jgi:hypothetical protein
MFTWDRLADVCAAEGITFGAWIIGSSVIFVRARTMRCALLLPNDQRSAAAGS